MANRISLDWRDRPSKSDLLGMVHAKLVDIDHRRRIMVDLAETRSQDAVKVEIVDGSRMWTRYSCPSSRNIDTHEPYTSKFAAVGIEIATMIQTEEMCKIRKLQYILEKSDFKKDMVKRIFNDWAVTLQVHPWALGIVSQEQGNATIPADLNVVCEIVPNLFDNESINRTIRGKEVLIPSRINKLTISTKPSFVLRAVVVTEHRNVDFASSVVRDHFRDVLLVQTGGYPTRNVKEFLNLLCQNPRLKRTPFFYISDHDFHGQHIFTGLKYGSMASAWASKSQICPRLQWAGPTTAHLHESVDEYAPVRQADRRQSNPRMTEGEAQMEEASWRARMHAKLDRNMTNQKIIADDESLYRGMINSGVLDDEQDLSREMRNMFELKQKFSLNAFSFRPRGAELYILERLTVLAPTSQPLPIANPVAQVSQATRAFNAADSQSEEVTPRRAVAAREMNISMN